MNLRDELQAIYRQHRDLTPKLVVDAARDESHPLHGRFPWDDAVAGERYRLILAAELIRSVRVVYKESRDGTRSHMRAFVSTGTGTSPTYQPTEEAMADPVTAKLILRNFERAIVALRRQYGHLKEYEAMMRKHGLGESSDAA